MLNVVKKEIKWGGRTLSIETGRLARQATGAVLVSYGETMVLCTVVASKTPKKDVDFFPLTVNYQEKFYAAGRVPGGYLKREGRPSDKETLTSRLIDRPIRPLFPEGFYNETQVMCTVLSFDGENDSDILAIVGASAALAISGIPFEHAVGAVRVGLIDDKLIINPTFAEIAESDLDLIVAGTHEGVLMVESEANELSEEKMLKALEFAHESFQPVIKMIQDLAKEAGKEAWAKPVLSESYLAMKKAIAEKFTKDLKAAYSIKMKQDRYAIVDALKENAMIALNPDSDPAFDKVTLGHAFKAVEYDVVRSKVLIDEERIDGRAFDEVRPITVEVGVLPKVHGSAIFTRGETQALGVSTLGTSLDEQMIDGLRGEQKEPFMLHYNFPPFSVGEVGRAGSPGRREIGHGKLAWRALHPMLPDREKFPYSLRTVVDILECNGSSSMATVCAASLSLMDAGVPLKAPVAGIAMGLVTGDKHSVVLSDIMGDEDFLGDMDFKVAGTEAGITSLQMDIKINGITTSIMDKALTQARKGRLHILGEMNKVLSDSRGEVNVNAPRMYSVKIDKEKIGELIGPGGKNIRELCETTGAKIDIEQDGTVKIFATDSVGADEALRRVKAISFMPEVNQLYIGEVVSIKEFGAFVRFDFGKDGFLHISEISDERVKDVKEYLSEGMKVRTKLVEIDDKGRLRLTMKNIPQLDAMPA
ncbi:polyribonucleotide nucleotidyltransferase [Candidatus Bodocaedibacter vickermanii]|uniref:Polyribonucleotide nucleotidyltransferase n=1 Tax=Candidatus Bodocaedibacter vickermanii TaxID=2741701 RepID=A0A7L9RTG9_9PROT|nr:Polyribonucleotide nucleotidyltransferase [Candidatus Paracaedibacteraceae bacterium 'Lake Konstanz']